MGRDETSWQTVTISLLLAGGNKGLTNKVLSPSRRGWNGRIGQSGKAQATEDRPRDGPMDCGRSVCVPWGGNSVLTKR